MKSLVNRVVDKAIRAYWWVKHLKKCPDKDLTVPNTIRYCHRCFRFRFRDSVVEGVFNQINKGK